MPLLLLFRPDRFCTLPLFTSPIFYERQSGLISGGERGIRTLDAPFRTYTISNRALSTTQTPLLRIPFWSAEHQFGAPVFACHALIDHPHIFCVYPVCQQQHLLQLFFPLIAYLLLLPLLPFR